MKVQACPSCGARYNVARLEPGSVFACRRCSEDVTVGAAAAGRGRVSVGLLIAGFLMLGCTFLYANPFAGFLAQRWPWEQFQQTPSIVLRWTFVLWTALALWTIVTALVPRWRFRSLVTLAFGGFLLLLATAAPDVGFTVDPRMPLPWVLTVIALSAGLELTSRGHSGLAARSLALIGALGFFWYHLKAFPEGEMGSQLQVLVGDAIRFVKGELAVDEKLRHSWYAMLGGYWCFIGAALLGLLVALGLKKKLPAFIGFLLVLTGLLVPSFVALGQELGEGVTFETATTIVMNRAAVALVGEGVALWLLGTYAAADLVRSRETAS